jgi:hypothetical protein
MKKIIMFAALLLTGIFAFSSVSMAYDDLITNDTAMVCPAGGSYGSVSFLYESASKYWADTKSTDYFDNATMLRVPLKAYYGVMDNLAVFGVLPIVSTNYVNTSGDSKIGIGDIWLGAKYRVRPDGCLTIRGALDLPAGKDKDGLGNPGGFGVDVGVLSMKQMDKIGLNSQVGLRWTAEGPKDAGKWAPGLGVYLAGQGTYDFTDMICGIVGLEFMNVGDGKADGTKIKKSAADYLDLNVGAMYKLTDMIDLRGDFISTLTGKNANQNVGVLLKVGYMMK